MGVVVLRRYIDILTIIINFPYSTCISSFFGSSIPTSLFIFIIIIIKLSCHAPRPTIMESSQGTRMAIAALAITVVLRRRRRMK